MPRRLPKVTQIKEKQLSKISGKDIFDLSIAKIYIQKQPSTISSGDHFSMYVGVKPVMFVKNAI